MRWGCADCTTKAECVFDGCKKSRTPEGLLALLAEDIDSEPFPEWTVGDLERAS